MTSDNILEAQMDDRRLNEKGRNGFPVCKKCGGQVIRSYGQLACLQCGYDQKETLRFNPSSRRSPRDRRIGAL